MMNDVKAAIQFTLFFTQRSLPLFDFGVYLNFLRGVCKTKVIWSRDRGAELLTEDLFSTLLSRKLHKLSANIFLLLLRKA